MKQVVLPGQQVDKKINGNIYTEQKGKYSKIYGVLYQNQDKKGKIIPVKSKYIPKKGDKIIGVVTSVKYNGYILDLNSPYDAYLSSDDDYEIGDLVSVEVDNVDEVNDVDIENDRKFYGGQLMEINPSVTERVIGKNASMISMIKEKTGSKIFVGMNGRVWIKEGNTELVEEAIRKIEGKPHKTGLTAEIKKFLEKETKGD